MSDSTCNFCDFSEYVGDCFRFCKNIDGGHQNFEVYLYDSPEYEGKIININGTFTDIKISINYCPMCGRKL